MKIIVLLFATFTSPIDQSITTGKVDNMQFDSLVSCERYKAKLGYSNSKTLKFNCVTQKGE